MSRATFAVAVAALCACAEAPWTRSDVSPAQAAREQTACEEQAEREISLRAAGLVGGSLSDNYGSTFQPYLRNRRIGATGPLDVDPTSRRLEQLRLEEECMRAKGYARPKS
jgi:hypothetical protein